MELKQYKAKIRNQLLNGLYDQAEKEKAIAEGTYKGGMMTPALQAEQDQMNRDYIVANSGKNRNIMTPRLLRESAQYKKDYELANSGGSMRPHYKIPKDDYDELIRRLSLYKGPTISMSGHTSTGHESGGGIGVDPRESSVGDHEVVGDDPTDVGGSFIGKDVKSGVRRIGQKVKSVVKDVQDGDDQVVEGGKFHFVKSLKHFGHDLGDSMKKAGISAVTKEVANEGVKFAKNNISKLMTGAEEVLPEALPVAEEVAPLALMAGEMKKPKRTRKVSQKEANRHALIRKLMKEHDCTLAEASKHIKEKNLSY